MSNGRSNGRKFGTGGGPSAAGVKATVVSSSSCPGVKVTVNFPSSLLAVPPSCPTVVLSSPSNRPQPARVTAMAAAIIAATARRTR
jgi:hypothetical protein